MFGKDVVYARFSFSDIMPLPSKQTRTMGPSERAAIIAEWGTESHAGRTISGTEWTFAILPLLPEKKRQTTRRRNGGNRRN